MPGRFPILQPFRCPLHLLEVECFPRPSKWLSAPHLDADRCIICLTIRCDFTFECPDVVIVPHEESMLGNFRNTSRKIHATVGPKL